MLTQIAIWFMFIYTLFSMVAVIVLSDEILREPNRNPAMLRFLNLFSFVATFIIFAKLVLGWSV